MNAPCAVMADLGRHLQSLDRDAAKDAEFEALEYAYTHDGIDWEDVAGRTEENVATIANVLALVWAGPDSPARQEVAKMLKSAGKDYAECEMQRKAA